jgi:hypothetical protein
MPGCCARSRLQCTHACPGTLAKNLSLPRWQVYAANPIFGVECSADAKGGELSKMASLKISQA